MYFDDEFIKSLPDDWPYAVEKIVEKFNHAFKGHNLASDEYYYIVEELHLLLKVFCKKKLPKRRYSVPNLTDNRESNVKQIASFLAKLFDESQKCIQQQADAKRLIHYKNVFEIAFEDVFHFEFTEGDLERIQQLINELRDLISKTKELDKKHQQRLLIKLEEVQKEFHKKMTTLAKVLEAIIEIGVNLGRFGKDIKPLTDRIGELAGIILSAQKRAYELPSSLPFKLFGQLENDKSKDKKS